VQTLAWGLAPTWLMDRCARRVGDTFTQTFAPSGFQIVYFSDPEAVKMLLTAPEEVAPKPTFGAGAPVWVLGRNSLSVLVGPEHMRQRKLLLPCFHGERLREHEAAIVDATKRAMARWPLGHPLDMQREMRLITLKVIMGSVFGMDAERMSTLQSTIVELIKLNLVTARLRMLVRGGYGQERPKDKLGRAVDRLDEQIYAEIARRRPQIDIEHRSDIMSMLLLTRDEDGAALTDVEVRDELVTLLLAGHETTAMTVAWAIERLVRHPNKLERLVVEIDAQRGGGEDQYLNAVINETLRVRPVQPAVIRTLTQDFQLGRYLLPAGTSAVASIYLTNRNPGVYKDPTAFEPERFLQDAPQTYSWIPFGGGIRRCIGASFAQMETKVIMRTILAELEPRAPHGWRARRSERMRWSHRTLAPSRGAQVVWQRRSRHSANGATQTADPIGATSAADSHDAEQHCR
jgi:cytochrome P450